MKANFNIESRRVSGTSKSRFRINYSHLAKVLEMKAEKEGIVRLNDFIKKTQPTNTKTNECL